MNVITTILRWLIYIPIGLTLHGLVFFGVMWFNLWLFADSGKFFIIVGLLLGCLFALLPMVYFLCVLCWMAVTWICPNPRIGIIIYATLYALGYIGGIVETPWSGLPWQAITIIVLVHLVWIAGSIEGIAWATNHKPRGSQNAEI